MTFEIDQGAHRLLLQFVLAQRLEINAIESALKNAGVSVIKTWLPDTDRVLQ